MEDFLKELTELSAKYGLFVTEWMDDLAVIDSNDELVSYIHYDGRFGGYVKTRYMGLPDDS